MLWRKEQEGKTAVADSTKTATSDFEHLKGLVIYSEERANLAQRLCLWIDAVGQVLQNKLLVLLLRLFQYLTK